MRKHVQNDLEGLKRTLQAKKRTRTYRQLAAEYGVNQKFIWNLINRENYTPPPKVCAQLGIAVYRPAPVCHKCGQVHITRRCTQSTRRTWRGWLNYPIEELKRLLDERKEL